MTIAGAVIIAAIAGALHWKKRVPRFVAWLLFLVGVGAASKIASSLGVGSMSIYGVGFFTILAIVTAIVFWEEAVKRNGLHRVRTPVVAVLFGVALMSATGAGWTNLQNAIDKTSSNIDQTVTTNLNGSK